MTTTAERVELTRVHMHRAVWSYLNAILPRAYTDDQIDKATERFIAHGLHVTVIDLRQDSNRCDGDGGKMTADVSLIRGADIGVGNALDDYGDLELFWPDMGVPD